MKTTVPKIMAVATVAILLVQLQSCTKRENGQGGTPAPAAAAAAFGPDTSPIPPDLSKGWCSGHGVPESVCSRCDNSLIERFKAAGDWCAEHGLPESQCTVCHPEVEALWAKLNPAGPVKNEQGATPGVVPEATLNEREAGSEGKWCAEHGVPESVCTRCNPALIARFKQDHDWCAEHGLPESQCTICNPEVRARWAALRPASTRPAAESAAAMGVERRPRLLTGAHDPLCPVETLRVRFIDPSIVRKAGIEIVPVRRRAMSATLDVPAEVEFDATRVARATARVAGMVREVSVNAGDSIETGELVAVLDSPALGEAKSRYLERAQDLKLAEADLQRVSTILDGSRHMLGVCTPDAAATAIREALSESPVGDAKAKLLRAHAALQLARSDAARQTTLLQKSLSSERDQQAAQSDLAAAEADFVALREEIAFDIEQQRFAAGRALEIARISLEAAERQLHILGLTDAQVAAIGNEPDELLTRYELKSPAAGTVIDRAVTAGEAVEATDVLFVVADSSMMWLKADLYERDLLQTRVGLPVLFTVDGLSGVSFDGTVRWISSQVDERTRTVELRADVPNPEGLLRDGMFGRARIVLHDNEDVVTVPAQSVQTDGCCQLVFVQESDTVFQPRKVLLGAGANGFVEVLAGVEEGDAVASAGSFLMKTEILKSNIGAGCCEVDPGR